MRVLALVLLSGCSFFTINGPPDEHVAGDPVVCDTERWPILFDAAAAFFGAIGAGGAVAEDAARPESTAGETVTGGETAAAIGAALVFAVPFTASAFIGRSRVRACQEARAAFVKAELDRSR